MIWNQAWFRFKRGLKQDLRTLDVGEPAITTDTQDVFVGAGTENIELARKKDLIPKLDEDYVGIPVEKIGLVADDPTQATSNTTKLNAYLASARKKTVLFLSKDYYFNNTITVTSTNKLKGTNTTRFHLVSNDVDFIRLKPLGSVEGLRLLLFENHSKAGIALRDDDFMQWNDHYLHYIKDIFIYGNIKSMSSVGIAFHATLVSHNVSNMSVNNVTVMWCHTGIKITSDAGWCNGNFFDNVYLQACKTGIYLGPEVGGNRFLYQVQFRMPEDIDPDDIGILCEGFNNIFIGMVWDTPLNHPRMVELTHHSNANSFMGMNFGREAFNNFVHDRGKNNVFPGFKGTSQSIPQTNGAYIFDKHNVEEWRTASWQQFYGAYSNILHRADELYTVNVSLGDSTVFLGDTSDFFNRDEDMILSNTPVSDPIVIEILFNEKMARIPEVGVTFTMGRNARYVKFEYAIEADSEYITMLEKTDNDQYYVMAERSTYGGEFSKFRITLADGFPNPLLNPQGFIGVGEIFMFSAEDMGNYYLPVNGGNMFGDLDMHGNTIRNKAWEYGLTSERPTDPQPYQEYFDTTIGRPIWWNPATEEWADAGGADGNGSTLPSTTLLPLPQVGGAIHYNTLNSADGISLPQQQLFGSYSNVLYRANKTHTANLALGDSALWYGTVDDFFDFENNLILANTTVASPIVLELILQKDYMYVPELGITFSDGRIAKYVKIEFAESTTSTVYDMAFETTNNTKYSVSAKFSASGANVGKIRITLADGYVHPTYNPQGSIGVGSVFMYSFWELGNYYLSAKGGKVLGTIDMGKQQLTNKVWHNGTTAQRPTTPVPFQEFYDTTLNKPIWRNAGNTAWVDANGTSV